MRCNIIVKGKVQGVYFRAFVRSIAERMNVRGYAKNLDNGDVEVFAEANDENAIARFTRGINVKNTDGAFVESTEICMAGKPGFHLPLKNYSEFEIER